MGRVHTKGTYITADKAIENKLQVLKDFYIIDNRNEDEYRKVLSSAVKKEPDTHFDIVLDRVAKKLISERLGG